MQSMFYMVCLPSSSEKQDRSSGPMDQRWKNSCRSRLRTFWRPEPSSTNNRIDHLKQNHAWTRFLTESTVGLKLRSLYLSIYLSIYLSVCLHTHPHPHTAISVISLSRYIYIYIPPHTHSWQLVTLLETQLGFWLLDTECLAVNHEDIHGGHWRCTDAATASSSGYARTHTP